MPGVPDIEYTFTDADIDAESLTTFGGQIIRPLSGRVEGRTWSLILLEGTNEAITSKLADADGRADWLLRLAEFQVNDDGGGWTTLVTHRIVAVDDAEETGYKISFEDERLKERNAKIFTSANTATVFPRGLTPGIRQIRNFDGDLVWTAAYPSVLNPLFPQGVIVTWKVRKVVNSNEIKLEVRNPISNDFRTDVVYSTNSSRSFAIDDFTEGAFEWMRFHRWVGPSLAAGQDHVIVKMGSVNTLKNAILEIGENNKLAFERPTIIYPSHGLSVGDKLQGFYYAPGRPPDTILPLHIGFGLDNGSQASISAANHSADIGEMIKRIYDGEFQDPNSEITLIKHDTNALGIYNESTNPDGLLNNPKLPSFGVGWRITGSALMFEWLEDNIYGPFQVLPFVQADGKVAPKLATIPGADEITLGSLTDLTDANVSDEQTSWSHTRKDIVTKITGFYLPEFYPGPHFNLPVGLSIPQDFLQGDPIPEGAKIEGLDRIFALPPIELTRESDKIGRVGESNHEVNLSMFHTRETAENMMDFLAQQIFPRYQDGPQFTSLNGTFDSALIKSGEFVKVSATAFPKLHETTPTRLTGTRIGQVIQVLHTPVAPNYLILDIGPDTQPLATLTCTAIKNTTDGFLADVTIGNLTAGANYVIQMLVHDSASPTHQMNAWRVIKTGSANETVTVDPQRVGRKVHFRAAQFKANRIHSVWSAFATVQLDGYSPPTSCAISNILSTTADISWVNGVADISTVIELDGVQVGVVPPGHTKFTFTELTVSTLYSDATVFHTDGLDGVSTKCNAGNFTTAVAPVTQPCTPDAPLVWKGDIS